MKAPDCLEFSGQEIEDLIERLEEETLRKEDYPLLVDLIKAIIWMNLSLQEKNLSIKRLRSIFGIKTETAERLMSLARRKEKPPPKKKRKKTQNKGSGHRPASDYTNAEIITVAHQILKKRDLCPDCKSGKLFNLSPGSVIRIIGTPWLQVEIYKPERLRCSLCGKIFTANLPQEIMKASRSDPRGKSHRFSLKISRRSAFFPTRKDTKNSRHPNFSLRNMENDKRSLRRSTPNLCRYVHPSRPRQVRSKMTIRKGEFSASCKREKKKKARIKQHKGKGSLQAPSSQHLKIPKYRSPYFLQGVNMLEKI